ncbi:MAG: GAF domain-containing protein [Anaerolineae bacterium]|nr:GAF domain-containing protein [Anaerolineae bacterium]NIN96910.1 GAF domain-containing protein [Anaerolineae bacterium]NIQ79875.1 GAF domain-containing protein [Anaerolineae bacterium]
MAGETVLVVDDAQGVIDFLQDYVLRPHGYQVLTAMDGEGGLSLAMSEKPDLMILDLEMPKMSGMEVLAALNEKGSEIPVIVITFHGSEAIAAQTFRQGVKNYITKPFKMEEILEAVEQALEESRLKQERAELVRLLTSTNKELERRISEFNILHGIGQAMNSLLRLEDLLKRAVEAAVYVTGAQEAALHFIDEETGAVFVGASRSADESYSSEYDIVAEDTVIQEVIETGRATTWGTSSGEAAESEREEQPPKVFLTVPLKSRGEVIGTLTVSSAASDRTFSKNDKYLLSVLADYVAIGVENARLYDDLERRAHELALLNEVGQALSSILDLEHALTLIMERVNAMFEVEAGAILLVDEEAEELVFQVALGEKAEYVKPMRLQVGQGIAGRVAQTRQPLLIPDVGNDSAHRRAIDISPDFVTNSVLCVPMIARGEIIGVIEVINRLEGTFTEGDQSLLSSIAGYAAVAIDNARLFREAKVGSTD